MVINEDGGSAGPGTRGGTQRGSNKIGVDFSLSYLKDVMMRNDDGSKEAITLNPIGSAKVQGTRVAAHEFGHSGGLPERNNTTGIMSHSFGIPSYQDRRDFFRGR